MDLILFLQMKLHFYGKLKCFPFLYRQNKIIVIYFVVFKTECHLFYYFLALYFLYKTIANPIINCFIGFLIVPKGLVKRIQ